MIQERKRNYAKRRAEGISEVSQSGNVPPQAVDIENAVLGAMMVNSESIDQVMDLLTPLSFYDLKNRTIFEAMLELFNERSPIDMLTVVDKLRRNKSLEIAGGPARLAALTQQVGAGANVEYYVRILQQKTIQRNLIDVSYGILKDAFDPSVAVDDLVGKAQDSVYKAIAGNLKNPYRHVSEVINASVDRKYYVPLNSSKTEKQFKERYELIENCNKSDASANLSADPVSNQAYPFPKGITCNFPFSIYVLLTSVISNSPLGDGFIDFAICTTSLS